MSVSGANCACVTTAFFFSAMTATPCVVREALSDTASGGKSSARPSDAKSTTSLPSYSGSTATSGLLSEYAPVRRRRFVLVSYAETGMRATLPFSNTSSSSPW